MAERKKQESAKKGAPEYMLTFGDLMNLLLCFFVMMLAMADLNPSKFPIAASSLQNAFGGVLTSFPTIPIHKNVMLPKMGGDEQNKRMAMKAAMEVMEYAKKEKLDEAIKVKVTDKGIAIKIADPMLFDIGKAGIKPEFMMILRDLMGIINKVPDNEIRVEGHTDNTPINTVEFPSNWELSTARAVNVIKYLYAQGMHPDRLSAVGYGEYRPIAPNTTAESRQKNRRIEIYVEYIEKKGETE